MDPLRTGSTETTGEAATPAPPGDQAAACRVRLGWALLAALATGGLTFLSFPEAEVTGLAWIALVPLRLALAGLRLRGLRAFACGWLAGWVANLGGFFWIVHLLVVFGQLPRSLAVLLFLLLAAYQGLVFGLWGWGTVALSRRLPGCPPPLLDAMVFTAAELLVPFIFPWLLGHSQYRWLWVAQLAELTGVAGLSCLLALTAGALAWYAASWLPGGHPQRRSAVRLGLAVGLLLALVVGWGALRSRQIRVRIEGAPQLRIGLVEANLGIQHKAQPEQLAHNLAIHQQLSSYAARRGAELIIWPETAYDTRWIPTKTLTLHPSGVPLAPDPRWDAILLQANQDHLVLPALPPPLQADWDAAHATAITDRTAPQRGFQVPLLLGAVTWDAEPQPPAREHRWLRRLHNSALLLDEQGRLEGRVYHKRKLLIFGEYLPGGRRFPQLHHWLPAAANLTPGATPGVFAWRGHRIGLLICYEAILPRLADELGQPFPDLLVSQTNDAWFGPHGEPWMHLALTVFRSIEQRVSLVRATNTGISAIIDPTGRIRAHTSTEQAEVLVQDVPLRQGPPSWRAVLGDLFSGLVLLVLIVLVGWAWWKSRSRRCADQSSVQL